MPWNRAAFAMCLVLGLAAGGAAASGAAASGDALDAAFAALATYDYGSNIAVLAPIDRALVDPAADHDALRARLAAALAAPIPECAKVYVCRTLAICGTAASVPLLAPLLADAKLASMARYALECIPCEEAVAALRAALPAAEGLRAVGIINSLGARRDAQSIRALTKLARHANREIAAAAVAAIGAVGTPAASSALLALLEDTPAPLLRVTVDACLICAEGLAAGGNAEGAAALYRALGARDLPRYLVNAALRGLQELDAGQS